MKQRRKDSKRLRKKLLILNIVLFLCMIVSIIVLVFLLGGYARDRALYQSARAQAVTTPQPTTADQQISEAVTPEISPEPKETPPIQVDFERVLEEGRYVRGWLYSEGTNIDYPVVAYTDNSFFLTHDYTGHRSSAGALFFDSRNKAELSGDQLIIYGHHMKDRSMFGSVMLYQKQEYYDQHPTLYLLTQDQNFRIEIFAGRFVDSEATNFPIWFTSETARKQYVQTAIENSDFVPDSAIYRNDTRIISLVTCAYSDYLDDAKYQLMGWLIDLGE
jgi:sortase B